MRRPLRLRALTLVAALAAAGAASAAPFSCRETPIVQLPASLPGLAEKLGQRADRETGRERTLAILAIGSSSTEGVGASSREKSYPSRLKALLGAAWAGVKLDMVNAGIGGETAPQTLARLGTALAERRYDLVIWQVGTNDAVAGGDLDAFRAMVARGIGLVQEAGASLVILDPQYFPGIREPARYRLYVEAIAETARARQVPVFTRYETMLEWHRADRDGFAGALAGDSFHMSDAGYDCLARDMAASLVTMTAASRPVVASSGR